MINDDFLNKLLGIEKLHVIGSEFSGPDKLILRVESSLLVASCPDCGQVSNQLHDESDVQLIRDLSIGERRCYLNYRVRRFKCSQCRQTFVERVDWKRPTVSYTERYERHIYQRVRRESIRQVADDEGLSEEAIQAVFEYRAKKRLKTVAIRM